MLNVWFALAYPLIHALEPPSEWIHTPRHPQTHYQIQPGVHPLRKVAQALGALVSAQLPVEPLAFWLDVVTVMERVRSNVA